MRTLHQDADVRLCELLLFQDGGVIWKAGSLLGSQGPFRDGEQGLDLLTQMCFQPGDRWDICRARGRLNPELWIKVFTGKQVC